MWREVKRCRWKIRAAAFLGHMIKHDEGGFDFLVSAIAVLLAFTKLQCQSRRREFAQWLE
jgi:hypothetical protein